jgi:protein O-GlcNAc transferase
MLLFGLASGITTLEAVAIGLPVITCPGKLMRGRHTYAILKRMGLDSLIASDLKSYEDLAVKLGSDPEFRYHMAEEVRQRCHLLFEDRECVAALAHFFLTLTKKPDASSG